MSAGTRTRPDVLPAAVLFDMDGTLIDSEPLWFQAELAVMGQLGGPWGRTDHVACMGGPLEHTVAYMNARLPVPQDPQELGTTIMDAMESIVRGSELAWKPGARELVGQCQALGLPAALVSASWRRIIAAVGDQAAGDLGGSAFDVIVAGDEVTRSKPDPEPYLTAAASLGVAAADCLAIEDSPTGVEAAAAAGCAVVAVPSPANREKVARPGVRVVDSLAGSTVEGLWAQAVRA